MEGLKGGLGRGERTEQALPPPRETGDKPRQMKKTPCPGSLCAVQSCRKGLEQPGEENEKKTAEASARAAFSL